MSLIASSIVSGFYAAVTAPGRWAGGQLTFAENVLLPSVSAAFPVVAEDSSFTPCGVYLWLESRAEVTDVSSSNRMDSAIAPKSKSSK